MRGAVNLMVPSQLITAVHGLAHRLTACTRAKMGRGRGKTTRLARKISRKCTSPYLSYPAARLRTAQHDTSPRSLFMGANRKVYMPPIKDIWQRYLHASSPSRASCSRRTVSAWLMRPRALPPPLPLPLPLPRLLPPLMLEWHGHVHHTRDRAGDTSVPQGQGR